MSLHRSGFIFLIFLLYQTAHGVIDHRYCIILAGGHGQRLWPLTNTCTPKPLLSVDGQTTLLDQTIERISSVVPLNNIWICSSENYADIFANHNKQSLRILVEP